MYSIDMYINLKSTEAVKTKSSDDVKATNIFKAGTIFMFFGSLETEGKKTKARGFNLGVSMT